MTGLSILLLGGMWTLGLWVRKAVECFKWDFMSHTNRSMEDSGAEADLNCGGLDQEVQRRRLLICSLKVVLMIF